MIRKGIDLSEHQKPERIDYDAIASQIDFVILRVGFTGWGTGATLNPDKAFSTHYAEFHKRKIPIGAYWYSCANTPAEGIAEAKKTIELIKGLELEYPIYFDTEDNHHQRPTSKRQLTDTAIAFLETLEMAGYWAGYYASTSWERTELDQARLKPYANWEANWTQTLTEKDCGIWQQTSMKILRGYNGNLDYNVAFVDYPKLIRDAKKNHLKPLSPYYPIPKPNLTYARSLRSVGVDNTALNMTRIANANGINPYSFTKDQNLKLLDLLRKGKLKKP